TYDQMMASNPEYITKTLLGNESSGLPIYRYDFLPPIPQTSNVEAKLKKILYISGTHGHEKPAPVDGIRFFKDLIENWRTNPILRMLRWNVHFIVIPVLNPYGMTNNTRKNANQVDLNRNCLVDWEPDSAPDSYDYAGPSPLSELQS